MLCTSCASYTYRGINVYDKQIDTYMTQEQIKEVVDYTFSRPAWKDILSGQMEVFGIDQTDGFYAEFFEHIFAGWDFVFTSNWHGVPLEDGRVALVDGITIVKNKVIFLKVHKCHGDSAFIHEVGHVVRQHFGLPEDRAHKDYEFWMIMKWLGEEMIDDLCSENYERELLPETMEMIQ